MFGVYLFREVKLFFRLLILKIGPQAVTPKGLIYKNIQAFVLMI